MLDVSPRTASHPENAAGDGPAPHVPISSERPVEVITFEKDSKLYYCVTGGKRLTFSDYNTNLNVNDDGRVVADTVFPTLGISIPEFVFDLVDKKAERIQLYGDNAYVSESRTTEDGQATFEDVVLTLPKGLNLRKSSRVMAGDFCVAIMGRYTPTVEKAVAKMKTTCVEYVRFFFYDGTHKFC